MSYVSVHPQHKAEDHKVAKMFCCLSVRLSVSSVHKSVAGAMPLKYVCVGGTQTQQMSYNVEHTFESVKLYEE